VQAAAELSMGLVVTGVGLIPVVGGCKELIARLEDPRRVFELIGSATISESADQAKQLGLLEGSAGITMNPERLVYDAQELAISLCGSFRLAHPRVDIRVGGEGAYAALRINAWLLQQAGRCSEHDLLVAEKLARVITGGHLSGPHEVSEQYLLDLEREAFLSLCGHPLTQARIRHWLETGQPLRN